MSITGRQNFVRRDDIRLAIVEAMLPPEGTGSSVLSLTRT